jgi:hypothetical protein
MHSDAILLAAAARIQDDDKFRLGPDEWRKIHHALTDLGVDSAYRVELREWRDGLWSCTYGLTHSGPMLVDLGNMTLAEWFRREKLFWWTRP